MHEGLISHQHTFSLTKAPTFNSHCKYHIRRCKCHLTASGTVRRVVPSLEDRSAGPQAHNGSRTGHIQHQLSLTLMAPSQNIPFPKALTTSDRMAMQYFYKQAALDLSGYLPGRFWDGMVLQYCQHELLVQQAVIAVALAHLEFCTSAVTSPTTLASYQKAVSGLRHYMESHSTPSRQVVLLCCILFFVFEKLRNDLEAALTHLRAGMTIVNGAKIRSGKPQRTLTKDAARSLHDLYIFFIQLDIEATMQSIDSGPQLKHVHAAICPILVSEGDDQMRYWTPHEAYGRWMVVCHIVWSFISANARYRHKPISEVPKQVILERLRLLGWVRSWRHATKHYTGVLSITSTIQEFLADPQDQKNKRRLLDQISASIKESHYYVIKCFLTESLEDDKDPNLWDRLASKLLRSGENTLTLRRVYDKSYRTPLQNTFSTHVGIVESLLSLAHRTTLPVVRAQAQSLIRNFTVAQEGLSGLTAFFAGVGAPPDDFILIYERPGH